MDSHRLRAAPLTAAGFPSVSRRARRGRRSRPRATRRAQRLASGHTCSTEMRSAPAAGNTFPTQAGMIHGDAVMRTYRHHAPRVTRGGRHSEEEGTPRAGAGSIPVAGAASRPLHPTAHWCATRHFSCIRREYGSNPDGGTRKTRWLGDPSESTRGSQRQVRQRHQRPRWRSGPVRCDLMYRCASTRHL